MMMVPLDVGSIEARLGAIVENEGFALFDKKVEQADRKKAQAKLGFDVNEKQAKDFELKVKRLDKMQATASLDLDVVQFDAALKEGQAQLVRLERRRAKAVIDLDVQGAQRAQAAINDLELRLSRIRDEKVKLEVEADHRPLGVFGLALDRVGAKFVGAEQSVGRFNRTMLFLRNAITLIRWPALIVGAGLASQAISSLAAGVAGLTGSLTTLGGVLATIPQAFLGIATAASTTKLAFSGIGDAVSAAVTLGDSVEKTEAQQRALADAMSALPAAGQGFARFLVRLKPLLDDLRATAAQGLLPGLERGIRNALPLFEPLRRAIRSTARAMGDAAGAAGAFLGSKGFGRDFTVLGRSNALIIGRLGRAFINLAKAMTNIAIAARPLTEWLSKITLGFARWTERATRAGRETGRLRRFFDGTRSTLERLGSILESTGGALITIGSLGKKYLGDFLLKELDRSAQGLQNFTNSASGQNKMKDFFVQAREPLKEIGGLIGDITVAMLTLGNQQGFTKLIRAIRNDLLPALTKVIASTTEAFGPALIDTLTSLVVLLGKLAGATGPLTFFVKTIGAMADVFSWLLDHIPGLRSGLVGLASTFAIYKALNFAAAITGIKALVTNLARLRAATVAEGTTTIGQRLAQGILVPLRGLGTRVRRALSGIQGIFRRVFARAGAAAGEAAAAEAAGSIAGETAAGGRLGKLRGRFGKMGGGWGRAAGVAARVAFIAAFALAAYEATKALDKLLPKSKTKTPATQTKGTKGPVQTGDPSKSLPTRLGLGVAKIFGIGQDDDDEKQTKRELGRRQKRIAKTVREHKPQKIRTRFVEIDPVVGISGLPTTRGVRRQMDRVSETIRREFAQLGRLLERQARRLDDPFRNLRLLRGRDPLGLERAIRRSGEDSEGIAKRFARRIGQAFESISRFARIEGRETGSAFASGLNASAQSAERRVQQMRDRLTSDFKAISRVGSAESRELVSNMRATFGRLPDVVGGPTGDMLRIVASALRSLGASGVARVTATARKIEGRAFGGTIPGYSRVDDQIIAVRGGEEVHTPEVHVPLVNRALAFASQFGVVPFSSTREMFARTGAAYASGGQVVPKPIAQEVVQRVKGFAAGGVVPAVQRIIDVMTKRFPLQVTSTTGGGHASGSYHYKGEAVDLAGPPEVMKKAAAFAKRRFGSGLLEGIHNPNLSVKNGKVVPAGFWGAQTWAGHRDHLHLAQDGGVRGDAGLGGSTARVRASVRGPKGAVTGLARGAVASTERAANRMLSRKSSEGPSGKTFRSAPPGKVRSWLTQALKATDHFTPANLSALFGRAMQESGGNPRAVNRWDSNAKAGHPSKGLLQTIDSTFQAHKLKGHGNILNPVDNAIAAVRYMYKRYGHIVGPSGTGYAKGGVVGRAVRAFQRGGLVRPAVRAFARGGTVKPVRDTPPRGAKRPTTRVSRRTSQTRHGRIKPYKLRPAAGLPNYDLGQFEKLWNTDLAEGSPLMEDYSIAQDDAGLVDEVFLVDAPGGAGQTVDWTAVRIRIGELEDLQARAGAIQNKIVVAQNMATTITGQLKKVMTDQIKRAGDILRQLVANLHLLKRAREHLKNLRAKTRRTKAVRDATANVKNLVDSIEDQNVTLSGSRDQLPRNWLDLDNNSSLGQIARIVTRANEEVNPTEGGGIASSLLEIQGSTGRGGRLREIVKEITGYGSELADLRPGGKNVTPAAGTGATTSTGDVSGLLAAFAQIQREFAPNFRVIGLRHLGGAVAQSGMYELLRGERVVNDNLPTTDSRDQSKRVTVNNFYKTTPEDPHGWSRDTLFELKAAI